MSKLENVIIHKILQIIISYARRSRIKIYEILEQPIRILKKTSINLFGGSQDSLKVWKYSGFSKFLGSSLKKARGQEQNIQTNRLMFRIRTIPIL